ncbi:MAG TPA: serine hydrolase domain-containing protein [Pseudonocardia sp.]|nr:serine hydrolase domain-containing protein [Pseudonocardia sp.]
MDNVDLLLERAVGAGHVSGVVAMASVGGRVTYSGGFGSCAAGGVTPDTEFPLRAMARPVLAVAALRLVDAGLLRLDDPLDRVLPELASLRRLTGFDATHEPRYRPARGAVTLRRLLSHTSGLLTGAAAGTVAFEPGTRWLHNSDLRPLGRVIERVSARPLAEWVHGEVLVPLGMRQTGFDLAHVSGSGGSGEADGLGFYSTPRDYLKFAGALLCGEPALLSRQSGDLLRRNQIGSLTAPRVLGLEQVRMPGEINFYPEVRLYPAAARKWSLGFMLTVEPVPGGPVAGSLTCAGGRGAYCWLDPSTGVTGLLFARCAPGGPDRTEALFSQFQSSVYTSLAAAPGSGRRRRSVFESLFQGWSSDVWLTWWPM